MRSAWMLRGLPVILLAACNPAVHACTAPGAAPAMFECGAGEARPAAYFPGLVAERVTIRVTTSAGVRMQELTPAYEAESPNGRSCPPACRQATVTVQL